MRLWRLVCVVGALAVLSTLPTHAAESIPGRILFIKDGDLWLLDATGSHQLATGGTFSQPAWAPDGATFAYVYRGNNFSDIFVSDAQGQNQTRLTNSQSTILENNDWNLRPTFSPDGRLIAFVSDRSSAFPTLWVMNALDGGGRHSMTTPGVQQEVVDTLAWSPDGLQLAVTVYNDPGPTQIALVPTSANGRQPSRVLTTLPGGALDPAWAPDSSWLAFAGRDGYASEIYAVQPDGSSLTKLTADGVLARAPTWSPDGRHLAYLSSKTGYFEVFVLETSGDAAGNLVASSPRQLTTDLHIDAASGLSWGR